MTLIELMKLHDAAVAAALDAAARSLGDRDNKTRSALQSALETLQAENERLKAEREALRDSAKEVVRLRDALAAKLVPLEADAERLDWLEQNLFNRENVDWLTGKVSKTHNMWVMFAPVGVQGSARGIIDAAKGGQQ